MQAANRLQLALKSGKPTFGGWQMLPGPNLTRALSRTPNLDWLLLDTEHGNLSDTAMHESVAAAAACGVSPVVRVPEGQHWMIKRALDAGAHAVLVPLVRSAAQTREIVAAAKFPPRGTRGLGSPFAMEKFAVVASSQKQQQQTQEISMDRYFREANDATLVIVQIETVEAFNELGDIVATPGVDVVFVGPYDLGIAIGHPVRPDGTFDDQLEEAIGQVRDAAQRAGKWTGIYCSSGEQARTYTRQGFNMASAVNDHAAIKKSLADALAAATRR